MINPNIAHAVSEALEAHGVTARTDERMADSVARAIGKALGGITG